MVAARRVGCVDVSSLEIERVWLLERWPELPADVEVWEIEQGYLPETRDDGSEYPEGRLRRIRRGEEVLLRHTVKRGAGLVREETERPIDAEAFERLWPLTEGRRIAKTRFRVRETDRIWEIDRFRDLPLAMVEVELPDAEARATPPAWLAACLGREVTTDPRYRNAALAIEGMPGEP